MKLLIVKFIYTIKNCKFAPVLTFKNRSPLIVLSTERGHSAAIVVIHCPQSAIFIAVSGSLEILLFVIRWIAVYIALIERVLIAKRNLTNSFILPVAGASKRSFAGYKNRALTCQISQLAPSCSWLRSPDGAYKIFRFL